MVNNQSPKKDSTKGASVENSWSFFTRLNSKKMALRALKAESSKDDFLKDKQVKQKLKKEHFQPPSEGGFQGPKSPPPSLVGYIIWLLILTAIFSYWSNLSENASQSISYSEFKNKVRSGSVSRVVLQGENIIASLRPFGGETSLIKTTSLTTTLPPMGDESLMPLLEQSGVEVYVKSEQVGWFTQLLVSILPWLLILGLFWYASFKMQERIVGGGGSGGIFSFGKSRARHFSQGDSNTSFDDVAGLENAKNDLSEITSYLKEPERYRKLGAKIPKGILLMGPPGTGKTLLARAVAGEAEAAFFSISGSEFIEMFVGVGASRVRDMFARAKKEAPSIIFIDEIDSVGRARGTGLGGGHDEREQTLNQILGEMDGFEPHQTVVVLAATNRPDVLDPALLRPGRFDRKITLDLPDKKSREAILKLHSRDVPLGNDVELKRLSALTIGFSGADLENLINEAALLAGRDNKAQVEMAELLLARDKIVMGSKREIVISDNEKKLIAYHEAGHVLLASLLPNADPLDKVTIIPRGRALGLTEQLPEEERHSLPQSYLIDRIGVMLGGRIAEKIIFNEMSSGAEDDLKQATKLARHMVTHWGMSDKLGAIAFRRGEEHIFLGREMTQQRDYSEHTSQIIDDEIRLIIQKVEKNATELLVAHQPQLVMLAEALLQKETLEASEVEEIINKYNNAEKNHGE